MSVLDTLRARYDDAVAKWRSTLASLDAAETGLYNVYTTAASDPATLADWQSKLNKINAIKATIQSVEDAIATVSGWIASAGSAFGLSGTARSNLGGLGIIPALPWAWVTAIVGGTAAIAAVVYEVNNFVARMAQKAWNDENIRRSQEGEPPLDPNTAPQAGNGGGDDLFGGITSLVKWSIAGFILYEVIQRLPHQSPKRIRSARA